MGKQYLLQLCGGELEQQKRYLTTTRSAKINSHHSIIDAFETHFPTYHSTAKISFGEVTRQLNTNSPSEAFANSYYEEVLHLMDWIKEFRHAQQN